MPAGVLVAVILAGERSVRQAATGERFGRMLRLALPFICGLISPVIAFLVPYARSGAVGEFFSGVTLSAVSRSVGLGVMGPVPPQKAIFALVLVGLIAAAMYRREFQSTLVGAAVGLGLTVMLVKSATTGGIVSGVWYSVATLTPLVVLLGAAFLLAAGKASASTKLQKQRVMVLICLAAMCRLVHYPFSAPIYFCFAFPLTFLAWVALSPSPKPQAGTTLLASLA